MNVNAQRRIFLTTPRSTPLFRNLCASVSLQLASITHNSFFLTNTHSLSPTLTANNKMEDHKYFGSAVELSLENAVDFISSFKYFSLEFVRRRSTDTQRQYKYLSFLLLPLLTVWCVKMYTFDFFCLIVAKAKISHITWCHAFEFFGQFSAAVPKKKTF